MSPTLVVVALCAAVAVIAVLSLGPHHHADSLGLADIARYQAMWLLMTVAMMMPTAYPLVRDAGILAAWPRQAWSLRLATTLGYLAAWLAAGVLAYLAQAAGHQWLLRTWGHATGPMAAMGGMRMPRQDPSLAPGTAEVVAATVLAAAGIYQFLPLANRCLRACRTPFGFFARRWRSRTPLRSMVGIGLAYGTSCVGCCAALMATLVIVGMDDIRWMAALGVLMAAQKNTRHGDLIARGSGVVLIITGGALASSALI